MDEKYVHVYYCDSCKEGSTVMGLIYACVYCGAKTPTFNLVSVLDRDRELPVPFVTVPRSMSRLRRNRRVWWRRLLFGGVYL